MGQWFIGKIFLDLGVKKCVTSFKTTIPPFPGPDLILSGYMLAYMEYAPGRAGGATIPYTRQKPRLRKPPIFSMGCRVSETLN